MAIKLTEEIVEIIGNSLENVPTNLSHKKAFLSETKHDGFDSRWAGRQRDILPKKYKKILASLVGKTEKEVRDKLLLSGDKGATIDATMLASIYDYYFCIYNEGYLITNHFRIHIDEYHNEYFKILYYFIDGILHSTSNVKKKDTVKRDTTEYSNIYEVKDNFVTFIISNKYEWGKQLFRKVELEKGSTNYVYPTYTTDEAYSVKNKILHSHNEREAYIHVNNNMKRINKKANFDMMDFVHSYSFVREHNHTISYNGNFYLVRLAKQDWSCPNTTIPMTAKETEKAMSHLKDFISTK